MKTLSPEELMCVFLLIDSVIFAFFPSCFGSQEAPPAPPPQESPVPEMDLAAIQKLTGLMGKAGMDNDQKALLSALSPYISSTRIHKLEKAMRAAKLAGVATTFLGNSPLFSGR